MEEQTNKQIEGDTIKAYQSMPNFAKIIPEESETMINYSNLEFSNKEQLYSQDVEEEPLVKPVSRS